MTIEEQDGIDFDDVESVVPDISYQGKMASSYEALSTVQRSRLLDELHQVADEQAVKSVLGPFWDWKRSSYGNYAKTHEELLKSLLRIDAPTRNGNLIAVAPTPEEHDVAARLHDVSVRFVKHHFGSQLTVFRGLNAAAAGLVKEVLENPSAQVIEIDRITALSNFTTSRIIARHYGVIFVEVNIPVTAVAVAPDFILKHLHDEEVINADAELRLNGDVVPGIAVDQAYFPASQTSVREALKDPGLMVERDYERMRDILAIAVKEGISIKGEFASEVLWNWFDSYRTRYGAITEVDKLLRTVLSEPFHL